MSLSFFDNHTLYVRFDVATEGQILECFKVACANYKRNHDPNLKVDIKVNLVQDHQGKHFGFAFVFITNSSVYHMLLGKNPDGTDRIQYIDDPTWVPPAEGPKEEVTNEVEDDCQWSSNGNGWASLGTIDKGKSWADIIEEEEEEEKKKEKIRQAYICPKIKIELEPLMVLPPIKLTPQQIEDKKRKIIEYNENKPDFDPNLIKVEEYFYLNIDRAGAKPVDPKYMPNILRCTNVPSWVTPLDLKMRFKMFATDSVTMHERSIKGRKIQEQYPFININAENIAFVIFDPSTYDAYFALHMMKKTVIIKSNNQGGTNTCTLVFTHSFRTDRDIMTTLGRMPKVYQHHDISRSQSRNKISSDIRDERNIHHENAGRKRNDNTKKDDNIKKNDSQVNSNFFGVLGPE